MPLQKEKDHSGDVLTQESGNIPAETQTTQPITPQEGAGFGMQPIAPDAQGQSGVPETFNAPLTVPAETSQPAPEIAPTTPEAPVLPQPEPQEQEPEPVTPETISTSEQEANQAKKQVEGVTPAETATPGVKASKKQQADNDETADPIQKTQTRKEIEEVLSEGLTELYQSMTPQEQQIFRQKGEEAATTIEAMVGTFRATAKKVVEIIRGWLSTIPRVNKYFLEQESKLKTDEIIKLQRKLKKDKNIQKIKME